ncbi:hypothetical protein RN001_016055 [Aquatica leii]|uniref:Uncharacterized protein n=1 Tax=Aquatica leii TaxID=1421715 RepID=A0AAN7NYV9_9COLE|nr:hypothetical protein RN001_016055 [Aquatica leii]
MCVVQFNNSIQNILAGHTSAASAAVTPINANSNFSKCQLRRLHRRNQRLQRMFTDLRRERNQGLVHAIGWLGRHLVPGHALGLNKPLHQIFREFFSKEQGENEPTDVFVTSARALLTRLPSTPELHQTHQIDMIYGLLNW